MVKLFVFQTDYMGSNPVTHNCHSFGEIGRHDRLKICFLYRNIGSSPIVSIFLIAGMVKLVDTLVLGTSF